MRSPIKIGGFTLVVLTLATVSPSAQAAKKATTQDQVAVLLKWSRESFDEGKYKQAEQYAELAREMAPDDPHVAAAWKVARRQQSNNASTVQVGAQLERVLLKLDRVERQLRDMESQKRQRARAQIAKEPPGSPDANY
jgi:hypothetical protein